MCLGCAIQRSLGKLLSILRQKDDPVGMCGKALPVVTPMTRVAEHLDQQQATTVAAGEKARRRAQCHLGFHLAG